MRSEDTVLISRYQLGDPTALDALILRHTEKALQQAFGLTHDTEQANDVVAEAFLKVCRSLVNFQGKSSFTTWLHRIIVNSYLDARYKAIARPTLSLSACTDVESGGPRGCLTDPSPGAQFEVERRAETACLRKAIDSLPANQRSIIEMYYIYSLDYDQITRALELPMGTVKSRLCRARMAMRRFLSADREMLLAA